MKTYVTRCELRQLKQEKLNHSDPSTRFELHNELESLNKEIDDLKRNILLQNQNILKELDLLDSTRVHQMKKLISMFGINNHHCFAKVDEYLMMRPP